MSLQVQARPGKIASCVQPVRQGEPLDQKMITAPKVIAKELAAYGGQAMPLLEGNQADPVTSQISVTAQQEQTRYTVNRSSHGHKNERTMLWGIDSSIARLQFLPSRLLLKMKHDATDRSITHLDAPLKNATP
jgi:hypothetical protein